MCKQLTNLAILPGSVLLSKPRDSCHCRQNIDMYSYLAHIALYRIMPSSNRSSLLRISEPRKSFISLSVICCTVASDLLRYEEMQTLNRGRAVKPCAKLTAEDLVNFSRILQAKAAIAVLSSSMHAAPLLDKTPSTERQGSTSRGKHQVQCLHGMAARVVQSRDQSEEQDCTEAGSQTQASGQEQEASCQRLKSPSHCVCQSCSCWHCQ